MIQILKQSFFIVFFLTMIVSILIFSDYFSQYHDIFLKILNTVGIIMAIWFSRRLLSLTVWRLYEKTAGRAPPHLVLTLQNVFLVMVGLFFIVGGIFHGSLLNVMAAGGLLTAGLAFALQGVIYDWFSGIVLDLDGPYQINDWVRVRDVEGRVIDINWRHTTLMTTDNQIVYAPNSLFLTDAFKNLSRLGDYFYHTLTVTIDAGEPIDRVRRVVQGELATLPFLYNGLCDVSAKEIGGDGVVYVIKYALTDYGAVEQYRHQVLTCLMATLHRYKIQVNDNSVRQLIQNDGPRPQDDTGVDVILSALKKVDLLTPLSPEDFGVLSLDIIQKIYPEGRNIVVQGEPGSSLYIVLEGLVEISLAADDADLGTHVAFLKSGDFFGDKSLLMGEPRSATVRARTDVLVLEISKSLFERVLKQNPAIIAKISQIMTERTQETTALKLAYVQSHNPDTLDGFVRRIEHFFGFSGT